jgi:hypothetical protein
MISLSLAKLLTKSVGGDVDSTHKPLEISQYRRLALRKNELSLLLRAVPEFTSTNAVNANMRDRANSPLYKQ